MAGGSTHGTSATALSASTSAVAASSSEDSWETDIVNCCSFASFNPLKSGKLGLERVLSQAIVPLNTISSTGRLWGPVDRRILLQSHLYLSRCGAPIFPCPEYRNTLIVCPSRASSSEQRHIPVVYFEKEEFPEIEAFMRETAETYGFEFVNYAKSYKDGMQDLVDSRGIEAVIMGQRRGDPWTKDMEWFTPSSPGWAKFTRVNPALEWKFCHVWRLLRSSGLPYCVLYDQGYTSLGERGDTAKNEALRLPDGGYRPAYELAEREEHLERSPRTPTNGSPRSPPRSSRGHRITGDRDGASDGSDSRSSSGAAEGGEREGEGEGEGRASFASWDRVWNSGGGGSPRVGAAVAEGGNEPAKGVVPASGRGCLQPAGKGRGGGLTGWVESWLPVTTVMLALALAAVGLRSYAGSPREGGHGASSSGAQEDGD